MPWISAKDFNSFRLYDSQDHITAKAVLAGAQVAPEGAVLVLVRGMTLHKDAPVGIAMRRVAFNQDVKALVPKDGVDPEYLAYWLLSKRSELLGLVDSASHGTGRIQTSRLAQLQLDLPALGEQRNAIELLSFLDDKIELNRKMNRTLEEIAQTLFRAWFVDFEGETDLVDSELGPIPRGWEVAPLPEVIDVNPRRKLSKGEEAPYLEMKNMPTQGARALDWYEREYKGSGTRFLNGDTLVARITPCLENGKTAFVDFLEEGQVAWGSTEYLVLRSKPPLPLEYAYFLARTPEFRRFAIARMTGSSGRQRVRKSALKHFSLAVPKGKLAERFGEFAAVVFDCLKARDEESQTLAEIRDMLLPKLISGEIRVPQAEELVEEAV